MEYMERDENASSRFAYMYISFMHFTCSWWINMMREIVLHEELSREDIECLSVSTFIFVQEDGKN